MTLEQIRVNGLRALARELGPVGLVRFLQQYQEGEGDYTAERHRWLPTDDVRALAERARQVRESVAEHSEAGSAR